MPTTSVGMAPSSTEKQCVTGYKRTWRDEGIDSPLHVPFAMKKKSADNTARPATAAAPSATEQALVDRYTEIARLAGALAHEIKNPLSTIGLNLELLAEDFANSETPRDRRALAKIAVVQRESQRLLALLDDFLKFTRVRAQRLEPADLNVEVEHVLEFFRHQAEEAKIEVIRYFDPNLPSVLLDREAFHGALLNLVINAQQAMPNGGQLVVRTQSLGDDVRLELIDTGTGIDPAMLPKIFEAFYSTKSGGSGLGLPTAHKIIEAQGGRIVVESEPGRGTKFTIHLPKLTALPAPS